MNPAAHPDDHPGAAGPGAGPAYRRHRRRLSARTICVVVGAAPHLLGSILLGALRLQIPEGTRVEDSGIEWAVIGVGFWLALATLVLTFIGAALTIIADTRRAGIGLLIGAGLGCLIFVIACAVVTAPGT